jgi:hypothetical protein
MMALEAKYSPACRRSDHLTAYPDHQELHMEERIRITGNNPPLSLWVRFPNWQNAYEEEGLPGQDETKLRPADNQQSIDDEVSFSAGDAVLANGKTVPAMLGLLSGELGWIYVYPDPERDVCWIVRFDSSTQRWVAMNEDWFLRGDGVLPVPVVDSDIFPMRIASRLPLQCSGQRIAVDIGIPA